VRVTTVLTKQRYAQARPHPRHFQAWIFADFPSRAIRAIGVTQAANDTCAAAAQVLGASSDLARQGEVLRT
jgi:hypothetical protein